VLKTLFSTPPIIMDFIFTAYFKVRSQFNTTISGVQT